MTEVNRQQILQPYNYRAAHRAHLLYLLFCCVIRELLLFCDYVLFFLCRISL